MVGNNCISNGEDELNAEEDERELVDRESVTPSTMKMRKTFVYINGHNSLTTSPLDYSQE
ncbi:hypothetical protein RHGRI_026565 [Rhododendron griersonianum]|uniref:Uncharacterized protein n=1 Tax=Rhododendron griersonianum TaxID=479676 RepID=A0AAV6IXR8_9ERIC|nr:hypothetical protein RHGRI_026565 [Rhododendron griersonianum]